MSEDSRDTILNAARKVFVEKGFAGASMSKIAQEAGVTQSLIHYHFKSKEELWEAVKSSIFRSYADAQREAFATRTGDTSLLEDAMRGYFAFLRANPDFIRMIDWHNLEISSDQQPDALMQLGNTVMAEGAQKIREAQVRGEFRADVNPIHVILIFTGVFENWFASAYCRQIACGLTDGDENRSPLERDHAFLDDVVRIVMRGLEPRH